MVPVYGVFVLTRCIEVYGVGSIPQLCATDATHRAEGSHPVCAVFQGCICAISWQETEETGKRLPGMNLEGFEM
jgi:hypothetical protein